MRSADQMLKPLIVLLKFQEAALKRRIVSVSAIESADTTILMVRPLRLVA